jgi:hypothetical protein
LNGFLSVVCVADLPEKGESQRLVGWLIAKNTSKKDQNRER